jgi:hypothetical protein
MRDISFFFSLLCIVTFTQVLTMYWIYHTWIHPFHPFLASPPIHGIVSSGTIFAFTYMWHTFFVLYSPSYPLSPPHILYTGASPAPPSTPGRTCSTLLFSDFVGQKREKIKWKIWHFNFFEIKVTTQEVFLWYFHIYIIYIYNIYKPQL